MKPAVRRQLVDIQNQADRLVDGKPSMEEIRQFDQYVSELKDYLLSTVEDRDIQSHIALIPRILDESGSQLAKRGLMFVLMSSLSSGLVVYYQNRQRIESAKENIREAKWKFSSIAFLLGVR